jgi:cytochrome P450
VAKRAADRLSRKLEQAAISGTPIDIFEEFRILTLQVISELILSIGPEESERVFPALYLPIVSEVCFERLR